MTRYTSHLLAIATLAVALLGVVIIYRNPDITTCFNFLTENHSLTKPYSPIKSPSLASSSMRSTTANNMKPLANAEISLHRSSARGHSDHGWLSTYHSFSFAGWYDPRFTSFGGLRVLNEDRVKARTGFPTHPHKDFEIFSYVLSGELTHRDSLLKGQESSDKDRFYRMKRGDVQFTTGGTGIAHSETNEHSSDTVHFLQIWAIPWRKGLPPRYHTHHFDDEEKKQGFVTILSPLIGGPDANTEQEKKAEPTIKGSIAIHSDLAMGAGIISPGNMFEWIVGGKSTEANVRKVYVHLPMTKNGKAKIRLGGREDIELNEGDGAFVEGVFKGDKLVVECIGEVEAEVVVLDTA